MRASGPQYNCFSTLRTTSGHILSTFPIVERKDRAAHDGVYLTAELIVHYKRMLEAGDLDAPYWGVTEPAARVPARLDRERQRAERLEAMLIRAASERKRSGQVAA
jgi:hypothetical protein